ncbi:MULTISPECIES: phosphatidylinositol-specific phospholipase C [unclassified Paraburkholderia]|uniref:phosphatidylinositol-specific phospholipase C n=1 Tax=unclassified Paraburkholderia TaxID=2615204 RepID=UPI0017FD722B|nr:MULTISPECIES: phosphatidylinositol-specific phospholipase C [unclassified Paraburkholderia]MBB5445517.1 1-phosphatidylinositol phosphodiesterase [Paraburkholderia sp. WSM4177]MBB5486003.1 1-phosphatidylinositol phosphodiesterase [Paraburkholderia sp. WSM4180]
MSNLSDDLALNHMTLPGSHDSCAYTIEDPLAKTQGATLAEQLVHGVRVLDIRCRHQGDVFHINHARIALGLMFEDVIAACAAFVAQHPGECIIMSVKDECGSQDCTRSFEQTFRSYVAHHARLRWYLGDTIPCLREVRGSIVLLRRFASESRLGIDLSAWPENDTFELNLPGAAFTIQDEYRVPVRASIDYKYGVIEALLSHTGRSSIGRWVINFCSGTGMGANPRVVACGDNQRRGINDMLAERLTSHDGPCGTVMIDFCEYADWALVHTLVVCNTNQRLGRQSLTDS